MVSSRFDTRSIRHPVSSTLFLSFRYLFWSIRQPNVFCKKWSFRLRLFSPSKNIEKKKVCVCVYVFAQYVVNISIYFFFVVSSENYLFADVYVYRYIIILGPIAVELYLQILVVKEDR